MSVCVSKQNARRRNRQKNNVANVSAQSEHERRKRRLGREKKEQKKEEVRQRYEQNLQQSWPSAWARHERACTKLSNSNTQPTDLEIHKLDFWRTREGSLSSCNEVTVRQFFAYRPPALDRKALRRQSMLWHPDRAMRIFAHANNTEAILKTVTMVSQVINGAMETC